IDGETAFRLYDTFGFPMEMTRELVTAAGIGVDETGFKKLLDAQRQRGRAAAKFSQDAMRFGQLYADLHERDGLRSTFTGYTELASDAVIRSLVAGAQPVDEAREGQDVEIVLDRTPFYPEGGGQVGDRVDITFGRALTGQELRRVEDDVNDAILSNASVRAQTMPLQDALASGATHLFDEKYGDLVRVVEAGPTSRELCGGTHCHCTGDI